MCQSLAYVLRERSGSEDKAHSLLPLGAYLYGQLSRDWTLKHVQLPHRYYEAQTTNKGHLAID